MDSVAAAAFYLGLASFCAGAIFAARATVERVRSRLAVPLLVAGVAGIAVALVAYAHGPRSLLPF